jgi:AcrR family transcriptional regulator
MILQIALRIVDRDGVDGLSIRRLSDAVGRDPVMLYRHVPNKAAVLVGVAELGQRPPGMLRPLEDVLALLTSAGFTGEDALYIDGVLFGYLYGHILNELQEVIERPEETDDVLRPGLHRLTITEFPQLRALAPAINVHERALHLPIVDVR